MKGPYCDALNQATASYCVVCGGALDATATGDIPVQPADPRAAAGSSTPSASYEAPDPLVGAIIADRYRVLEKVGQGGMGHVYKVEHLQMGKIMAMKVLHGDLAKNKTVLRRFKREAQAASRLNHPNSVQVFDFGVYGPLPFLVMEYLRGEDLGSILRREGPMDFLRTANVLSQVASSLSEAHEMGIVHRDIKPDNVVMLKTREGREIIKVLDFGLAKIQWMGEPAELTAHGSILGTPYYMSPEQIRGHDVDHHADIYSLGAVMYRMLTGHHAFPAETPVAALTKHLTDDLVAPGTRHPELGIPPAADAIVDRAMQKEASRRYNNVDEFKADLDFAAAEFASTIGQVYVPAGSTGGFSTTSSSPSGMTAVAGGMPGAIGGNPGFVAATPSAGVRLAVEQSQGGIGAGAGRREGAGAVAAAAARASEKAPKPAAYPHAAEGSWDLGPAEAADARSGRAKEAKAGSRGAVAGRAKEGKIDPVASRRGGAREPAWEGNIGTRADWESYERKLKRGRWLKFVIPILLLGGAGYGAYWWWMNERGAPRTTEVEPNDEPSEATALTPTVPLVGHIGRRRSATESDRDFYKIVIGATEASRALSVRVTGIPNINLKIDILEEVPVAGGKKSATPVMTADALPRGGDEWTVLFPAPRGTYYVLVSEVLRPDQPPTENVSDPYKIFALVEKDPPPTEDPFAKASALKPGEETTLYAGWGFEAAYLRLDVDDKKATLGLSVSAIAGVKMEVVVYSAKRESLARVTGTDEGAGVTLSVPIGGAGKPFIVVRKLSGDSGGSDYTVEATVE